MMKTMKSIPTTEAFLLPMNHLIALKGFESRKERPRLFQESHPLCLNECTTLSP
jgi:hypothetical protein